MQFLKDEIESKIIPSSKENVELTDYQYGHNIAYSVVLTLSEYLIEVEKQIILDTYIQGYSNWDSEMRAEEYYNKTYNQNK